MTFDVRLKPNRINVAIKLRNQRASHYGARLRQRLGHSNRCKADFVIYFRTRLVYLLAIYKNTKKFMEGIKKNEVPMPQDMVGKEMIVFGNVQQIYEWHKR